MSLPAAIYCSVRSLPPAFPTLSALPRHRLRRHRDRDGRPQLDSHPHHPQVAKTAPRCPVSQRPSRRWGDEMCCTTVRTIKQWTVIIICFYTYLRQQPTDTCVKLSKRMCLFTCRTISSNMHISSEDNIYIYIQFFLSKPVS